MDKNEELQKWLNDDRYVRAQELALPLNMDNGQVLRLLQKHKIHAVKRIYIGRNIDGQYLGQLAFFDKNQCLTFLEKWENGYDKHLFMSLNDICDTFNTKLGVVNLFLKRNKIKKCAMHRDANNYRIALYDKQLIIMLWTTERGLLQNLQPNPDFCIISELAILFKISDSHVRRILRFYNIKPVLKNPSAIPDLYCKKQCIDSINSFNLQKKYEHYNNDSLNQLLTNPKYIMKTELANELGLSKAQINDIFKKKGIVPFKKIYTPHGLRAFYDRAECERARPFINQPEKKEVEKVEEKQMELPKTTEQTPDIIPADTIDLFTMSELEAEFKKRGVELTADVRAKINASDMPEMQHIAKMLRGNAKTIAIRLSVLNEIAKQLKNTDESLKPETEIDSKDISQFYMPLFDIAESANMSKDKARYWLKLADCSPVVKDRVDLWPIEAVNILKKMQTRVENDMTPNAAAAILKIESHDNEATNDANQSDSEFTSIRIGKAERQKLRIMAAENRSGITEQLHLIINSLFGLTYRK
jgi:hypothetical protein